MTKSKLIMLATTAVLVGAAPTLALAQADADGKIGTIIVTARKRSEDALKVPVAVTAFSGADLATRNIKTTLDIANFTPSLTTNPSTSNGARVDRSTQQFVVRGLTPSNALNPTASVFIDGVPVGASDFLQNLDDIDHVEVLKGPQSAYFGRNTFAGAINAVSVSPGNRFTSNASLELGTRNTFNFSGGVTVPIVADKLSVRGGVYYDHHDGSYDNPNKPGETLGDQTTKSAHIAVTVRPVENLTIKAFAMAFQDKDGPQATGLLLANGPAAFNQSNCTINATAYFCGTLPKLFEGVSPAQVTTITAGQRAFFDNPGGLIRSSSIIKEFGLKRDAHHVHLSVEYVIPNLGATITYLGGQNRGDYSSVSDLANLSGAANGQYPGYGGFPFLVEYTNHDYSHEARITTDQTKPLRALLGASYFHNYRNTINYSLIGAPGPAPTGSASISKTKGIFFSVAYDVVPALTVNFDGRFQSDEQQSLSTTGAVLAKGTSHDFVPRVSVQYKFMPDAMVYATWSKGVNPGVFNTQFNTIPVVSQQALIASGVAGTLFVAPERITNYELGVKGRFLDGRATLSAAVYYDVWTDQLNANIYTFAVNDPANPRNVVGSSTFTPIPSAYQYISVNNSAGTHAKGVEVEANLIPVEHVRLNLAGAINHTRYTSFLCTSCTPYPTSPATAPSAAGKALPNSPEYTFSAGLEYDGKTSLLGATDWFARTDFIYRSGIYIQASNTVKTPDAKTVNVRIGVNWNNVTLEGYVNNLFNDKAYVSGFQNFNFNGGFAPAVMVGLPQLITGGARLRYRM